ncbi:hypothetical protein [Arenimonas metalli]|uniref:Uncharacterized protein n=1 Tax=Arenimonas metalli CF5-1 TaxID=1384056 RepID=A0A091BLC4_9GAMM|nr:hypothetical protein [Arenimonas metalli]KFN45130.1 hypothetical protein N787_03110 [Arenimonas metalli CF5-1]
MNYLVLLGLVLALAIHIHALLVSRRGHTGAHEAAFWGGILGMLSIPAALVAAITYLPFAITGPGNHPISWIAPATLAAVGVLVVFSLITGAVARRQPAF